jgi:geranylgeranyl reductase family protein
MSWDVAIVGAGPCGSMAALAASRAGLRVVLLDRSSFPRAKVCGDCLNPSAWPLLESFDLAEKVRGLPHSMARTVEFHGQGSRVRRIPVNPSQPPEMVVQRRDFDAFLLQEAQVAGVEIRTACPVTSLRPGWVVETEQGPIKTKCVIAADGRNSTVGRLLGLLPPGRRDRIGWQCHLALPDHLAGTIAMFFFSAGYGGLADCGGGRGNLCVVGSADQSPHLKKEACTHFGVVEEEWQSMSPIHREPASLLAGEGLFLAGDAARVVEPFTGEGIYYAMHTGLLAGEAAAREIEEPGEGTRFYQARHRAVYRGRMWVNLLSRRAGENPGLTARLLRWTGRQTWPLALLTRKVMAG